MGKKPNGRKTNSSCCNSREFQRRVKRGGGRIEQANGGSHFWGVAPNGDRVRAYHSDEYPRGTAAMLGKWLSAAGLLLVIALAVALIM